MFQVVVVDDEPSSVEFIAHLIEERCPGFSVLATAGNGRECLNLIRTKTPDVVVSDVKMPVMDGVELARRLRAEYPGIVTLMVSGYQEYDYVRGALKSGVYDYLLKPLTPSAFASVFDKLRRALEEKFNARRNSMLLDLSSGVKVCVESLKACFPEDAYDCVLVRRGALPKRFSRCPCPEIYQEVDRSLSIFGRDEMERICLRPASADLSRYMGEIIDQEAALGGYVTAVAFQTPFRMEHFADMLKRLYRALDVKTVVGLTQSVVITDSFERLKLPPDEPDALKFMEDRLEAGMTECVRGAFKDLMKSWTRRSMPQLWLERQLRYIVYLMRRLDGGARLEGVGEHLLDDAFYSITSMDEMARYMDELLFSAAPESMGGERLDTPDTFERVTAYVRAHFADPLTLESLAQKFSISQSYISKMFRKYEDKSFGGYLTMTRMEYAKKLLKGLSSPYVKDIAAMSGYADPFYFSRSFRAYTGTSPSEYSEDIKKSGGTT